MTTHRFAIASPTKLRTDPLISSGNVAKNASNANSCSSDKGLGVLGAAGIPHVVAPEKFVGGVDGDCIVISKNTSSNKPCWFRKVQSIF
jgi:hypothetical protein